MPIRSAVSSSAVSIVLPIRMRSLTPRNSIPTGSGISLETIPSVSEIGRPERSPRTIKSIASGNLALNSLVRFAICIPTNLCGIARPIAMPAIKPSGAGAPLKIAKPATSSMITTEVPAYLPSVQFLPVISSRLRRMAGRGRILWTKLSILVSRLLVIFRICVSMIASPEPL